MDDISRMLAVARGDVPADWVLAGGQMVNVFSGEIESADIAISGDRIAGIGRDYRGAHRIDLRGSFIAPGFIDAHVHVESSLCVPSQFAAAVIPRGVTAVVADPHEIANVAGAAGIRFMAEELGDMPMEMILMAPSCVPATSMATSGGAIGAEDLIELRRQGIVHGLGEVMNFPAVASGDSAMRDKLSALSGRPIDGHCPGVGGKMLNAYIAAGVGSDHESLAPAEAKEKLSRGMYLLIREASNARNLDALLPVVTPMNSRRVCLCTDDRTADHLLGAGSVDEMVRRAISGGIEPVDAIRMATLNTAEWFGLHHLGGIAPGRVANLIVFDDLRRPEPRLVFCRGRQVACDGTISTPIPPPNPQGRALGRCEVNWDRVSLDVKPCGDRFRVIGARPDQLVTDQRIFTGNPTADPSRDLLKIAAIERHRGTGNVGVGFIQGFGLKRGAIAGTVAHDHHNLIAIGADDQSMLTAARAVGRGGLAVAAGDRLIAHLDLPVGGLMSDRPIAEVAAAYTTLIAAAHELNSPLKDPFMAMSFMGLEVIPALKLTDQGLVDVEKFALVDLRV